MSHLPIQPLTAIITTPLLLFEDVLKRQLSASQFDMAGLDVTYASQTVYCLNRFMEF